MAKTDAPLAGLPRITSTPSMPVALDDVDLTLLQLLANDARTSQRGLARELGMSAPAIGERITRLERTGVIQAGFPVVTYLAITATQGYNLEPVTAAVRQLPEVETITVVTGELDLLARLRVRDVEHLRAVRPDKVWQINACSARIPTWPLPRAPPRTSCLT
ncbi:MAG: Lrp/AsnC family transcriptional regulator [Geodermatophilaceae bacterium]